MPYAQAIKDKGVKGLYFVGEPQDFGQLIAALAQINYKLDWIAAAANQYDPKLIKAAGSALGFENVYVRHRHGAVPGRPTSRRSRSTRTCSTSTSRTSTRKQAALGMNSFSSWLLFAQAAKACGADLTRKCMYDNASKVSNWDGGGHPGAVEPLRAQRGRPLLRVDARPRRRAGRSSNWEPTIGRLQLLDRRTSCALHGNYGKGVTLAERRQEHGRPPVATSSTAWTSSSSSRSSG